MKYQLIQGTIAREITKAEYRELFKIGCIIFVPSLGQHAFQRVNRLMPFKCIDEIMPEDVYESYCIKSGKANRYWFHLELVNCSHPVFEGHYETYTLPTNFELSKIDKYHEACQLEQFYHKCRDEIYKQRRKANRDNNYTDDLPF